MKFSRTIITSRGTSLQQKVIAQNKFVPMLCCNLYKNDLYEGWLNDESYIKFFISRMLHDQPDVRAEIRSRSKQLNMKQAEV